MTAQDLLDALDAFEHTLTSASTSASPEALSGSDSAAWLAEWLEWLIGWCEEAINAAFTDCLRKHLPPRLTPENVGDWLRRCAWVLRQQQRAINLGERSAVVAAARAILKCVRIQLRNNPVIQPVNPRANPGAPALTSTAAPPPRGGSGYAPN